MGKQLTDVRKDGTLWWLRPDGKTQVTIKYKQYADGAVEPLEIHTVVISTQHAEPLKAKRTEEQPGTDNRDLQLRQPKYNVTAAYGHFGREPYTKDGMTFFSWEDSRDLSKYASMTAGDVSTELAANKEAVLAKWVD